MAMLGRIEARCPGGCEPFETDAWSLVRGDKDEVLREMVVAGDLNLLSCPECGGLFFPEATVIYLDPSAELAAFVLPESYRADEAKWREKLARDFRQMASAMGEDMALKAEPLVLFGLPALSGIVRDDDDLDDEVHIAQYLAPGLGLTMHAVERGFCRAGRLPRLVPAKGQAPGRDAVMDGLKSLLAANDRLEGYRRWLDRLAGDPAQAPWGGAAGQGGATVKRGGAPARGVARRSGP